MRTRLVIALVAALALGLTAVAQAARITGGTTTITPTTAAAKVLSANHITVRALKPASLSQGSLVLPVARGHVNKRQRLGRVVQRGGVALTNGTVTFKLRHPVVRGRRHGVAVFAAVRRDHRRWRIARVARLTGLSVHGTTATATARLTRVSAHAVNVLAGHRVARPGARFATVTVAATVAGK